MTNYMNFSEDEEYQGAEPEISESESSRPVQEADYLKEELTVKKPSRFRKIILIFVILLVLTVVAGASFYIYQNIAEIDPIDLLPADTYFYIRIKANQDNQQFQNFKNLLAEFPNYEKIQDAFVEEVEKTAADYPFFAKIKDFDLFEEVIIVSLAPIKNPEDLAKKSPFVFIFSNPDLSEINETIEDIKELIRDSKDAYELKEENYQGRIIFSAEPKEAVKYYYTSAPKFSFALVNNQFIVSPELANIKEIIDVAESREITKIFSQDKTESITSLLSYKKVSKYLPKDYLVLSYSQQDWSEIFNVAKEISQIENSENYLNKLTASSLTALLNLSFLGLAEEESEKMVSGFAIVVEEDGLRTETYSLDLRENPWQITQFSFKEGLAKNLPEKISGRELVFYSEASNLKNSWDQMEEIFKEYLENSNEAQKKDFDEALRQLKEFEQSLGFDFKEDFISQLTKNYSAFLYADPSGEKEPIPGLIFSVDDESEIKNDLLKIKIPKEILDPFKSSNAIAKDARITGYMNQLRFPAILIYDDYESFYSLNCNHDDLEYICDGIEEDIGKEPTFHVSKNSYCAYTKLNQYGAYYCVDSNEISYDSNTIKTYINPGGSGYCTGSTFICPTSTGIAPILPEEEIEKLSFTRELTDAVEVYTLPIFEEFGLNFTVRDKKLIFSFTKQAVADFTNSYLDSNQTKLINSADFNQEFEKAPKNVTSISYIYPFPVMGIQKYATNYFIEKLIESESELDTLSQEEKEGLEIYKSQINEPLDKGIAPYLKMLKRASSYAYSPEPGLFVAKAKLTIEKLSSQEKQDTEKFWEDFWQNLTEGNIPIFPIDFF